MESVFNDVAAPILGDIAQERLIRVYPYELINANKSEALMVQQGVSLARISQNYLDNRNELLTLDENGAYYFEMLAGITSEGKLDLATQTSVYGQELKEEDSFIAISNFWYEGELEDIKIGNARFMPAVFSIGKPFDRTEYEAGNQAMFIASSMVEAKEGRSQFSEIELDTEGLYEFNLINFSAIESQFTNSRIMFYDVKGLTLDNPTTILADGSVKPGISVSLKPTTLLARLGGKGMVDGREEDVDLIVKEELTVIKGTPIDTTDKVSMYFDFFDYDVAMPEFIARGFLGGMSIEALKNIDIDLSGTKEPFFKQEEVNLIMDMLAYSSAFANSFSQFERNPSGSDAGKIKDGLTIGSKKAKLVALEGKDPIKTIDGLFEEYIRENPQDDSSIQFKALKEILAALSRYIYSSYAIGKGQNSFNQVYLPWYLIPSSGLILDSDTSNTGNYIVKSTTVFDLKSRWFDLSTGTIAPLKNIDISKVRMIQTDRKLTIPVVPYSLSAINKLPLPGDVNTKASTDLSYFWYMPINGTEFNKLFLNDAKVDSNPSNDAQTVPHTAWTDWGTRIEDRDLFVKNQAAAAKHVSPSLVTVVSGTGSIEHQTSTDVHQMGYGEHAFARWKGDAAWYNAVYSVVPNPTSNGSHTLTDEEMWKALTIYLGRPIIGELIEVVSRTTYNKTNNEHTVNGGSYAYKRERINDAQVFIIGNTVSISIDRDTVFDKTNWQYFINDFLSIQPTYKDYHLTEYKDQQIEDITELSISQIWGNEMIVHYNAHDFNIPLFNKDDETLTSQRILFT